MSLSAVMLMLAQAYPNLSTAVPPTTGILRSNDGAVLVQRTNANDNVVIIAELPKDWSFSIKIDGNRDGVWGIGPYVRGEVHSYTSADTVYGEGGGKSGLCTQYAVAAYEADPDRVYLASQCGDFISKAQLITKKLPHQRRRMTFSIPGAEIFGLEGDAHVQFCVWNTKNSDCIYSPSQPYILLRNEMVDPGALS